MLGQPLRLSTPLRTHVFGGHEIAERLGKRGLPPGRIAETWEISDVPGSSATVLDGPLAGQSLHDVVQAYPEQLVAPGWQGPWFPLLTKFIDGSGRLPVHLHADDATARRLECQPNGKTEAWHILWAEPGATALVGLKPGQSRERVRDALLRQDYDAVMRRLPVRAGETFFIPGGTLHSFGPGTLIYEIEQTSDIQQQAMPWRMTDGEPLPHADWRVGIEALLDELDLDADPRVTPGLRLPLGDGHDRLLCTACRHFALERWRLAGAGAPPLDYRFSSARLLSNVGRPVRLESAGWSGMLGAAESLLLPAALGEIRLSGPADLLVGYVPDLHQDIQAPLAAAGYGPAVMADLGIECSS